MTSKALTMVGKAPVPTTRQTSARRAAQRDRIPNAQYFGAQKRGGSGMRVVVDAKKIKPKGDKNRTSSKWPMQQPTTGNFRPYATRGSLKKPDDNVETSWNVPHLRLSKIKSTAMK